MALILYGMEFNGMWRFEGFDDVWCGVCIVRPLRGLIVHAV